MRHMNKRKLQPDLVVLEVRLLLSTAANAVHQPQNLAAPVGRAQTCGMTSNDPACGMTSNDPACAPMTTTMPVASMEPPAMAQGDGSTCLADVSM